jgi:branched-subunit amino acid ABC-type transport system permease component
MAQIIANGIMLSFLFVLFALGLSLIFGIMRVINFAHGEVYMLGAYGAWFFTDILNLNFFLGMVISMVAVGLLWVILERFILKPFRGNLLPAAIVTLGLLWIFQATMLVTAGSANKSVDFPQIFQGTVSLAGATLSLERICTIVIGVILTVALLLFLSKAKAGRAMRAATQNPDAARLMGVNIDLMSSLAIGISCALAAAGGVLAGGLFYINPYMGGPQLLMGFVIIIIGGLGSIPGTIIAAFIVGFINSITTSYLGSNYAGMLVFLAAIVVLLIRPKGLLGIEEM